jgi:nicotinate-nucleotide pyrophosphorylase (carboxylating)
MDWKSKRIRSIIEAALVEDKAAYDITTTLTIERKLRAAGTIHAKQPCVIAGLGAISVILETFGMLSEKAGAPPIGRFEVIHHPEIFDGVRVKKGQTVAVIRANAATLLSVERVTLNLLQRMSGIATLTNEFVKALAGTNCKVLDTRKTIPGLRTAQKYAVRVGGGRNHRLGLYDMILIKENHIMAAGSIAAAVAGARASGASVPVEIEVESLGELREAIAAGADIAMLDEFSLEDMRAAVDLNRAAPRPLKLEASGGVTSKRIRDIALTGVDYVSVGSITKDVQAVDLSMRFEWQD